jgi:hypothetical protein
MYDMLSFAVDHKAAVNAMTSNASNGLRAYEMDEREWGYADDLCSVLKVRVREVTPP